MPRVHGRLGLLGALALSHSSLELLITGVLQLRLTLFQLRDCSIEAADLAQMVLVQGVQLGDAGIPRLYGCRERGAVVALCRAAVDEGLGSHGRASHRLQQKLVKM